MGDKVKGGYGEVQTSAPRNHPEVLVEDRLSVRKVKKAFWSSSRASIYRFISGLMKLIHNPLLELCDPRGF